MHNQKRTAISAKENKITNKETEAPVNERESKLPTKCKDL